MNGQGIAHDAFVHMSSSHTLLNKAVHTATPRVDCPQTTEGLSNPTHL